MTFDLDRLTTDAMVRARLADVAGALLCRAPVHFFENLDAVDRSGIEARTKAFSNAFGWSLPPLASEWMAIEEAFDTSDSAACWVAKDRSLALDLPLGFPKAPDEGEVLAGYSEGFFAGLFKLGEHASGDSAFASLLPNADDVWVFTLRHESGDLREARTLKSYLIDIALSENDPEEGGPPGWVGSSSYQRILKVLDENDARMQAQAEAARALHAQSRWASRILWGSASPRLAKHLALAPTLEDWDRERAGVMGEQPFRLNYAGSGRWSRASLTGTGARISAGWDRVTWRESARL
jgi:hypothetical protein